MKFSNWDRTVLLCGLCAAVYILLAVIGGIRSYSPVPFWDMWEGIDSVVKATNGDAGAWWMQHNEHRIVFTRILIWANIVLFKGTGVFLIAVNYILAGLCFLLLFVCLAETLGDKAEKQCRNSMAFILLALSFSWLQKANFCWEFQSQFFLAQLVPLLSFYLLHRSCVSSARSSPLFVWACLAGVISSVTLASGILTLPLMLLLAMVLRTGWRRITVLATLAVITVLVYFYNYHTPEGNGSFFETLRHDPAGILQYMLLYLGGPFYFLPGIVSKPVAQMAGVFLIGSAVFFAIRAIRTPDRPSLTLALLTFLLYIGGTAAGTAGGRLISGTMLALSSRYQTPVLMAWSVLLILYAPSIAKKAGDASFRSFRPLLLIPAFLFPCQLDALRSRKGEMFERKVAALAIELGVKDQAQISATVYPDANLVLKLAEIPKERNLSIFGNPLIKDAAQLIGRVESVQPDRHYMGSIDGIVRIDGGFPYFCVWGWLFEKDTRSVPEVIHILNESGVVIGYALTGQPRPDVEKIAGHRAKFAGFKGYVLPGKITGDRIILQGVDLE